MNTQDFRTGMDKTSINLVQNENENVSEEHWNNVLPPETEKPLMTDYFIFKEDSSDLQEHPVFTVGKEFEAKADFNKKDNR